MLTSKYWTSVLVVTLALLLTAGAAVAMVRVFGHFFDSRSTRFGVAVFATSVLVLLFSLYLLASLFLFDKDDRAPLQVLGGAWMGGAEASMTGKTATWPFAKLSASGNILRLQTPWGAFAYGADEGAILRRTGLIPGSWSICARDCKNGTQLTFSAPPWSAGAIERQLKELGYRIE